MSIQIDNGDFTRIHNDILDGLAQARFSALEFRCVIFLVRMTYGWQKKEDAISLSQWATGLGIDKNNRGNILNTLNGLVAQGVIYTRSNGNNRPATWGIKKDFFEKPTVMQPHNSKSEEIEPTVMPEHNTTVMQPHNTLLCNHITDDGETVMQPHNHKRKVLKKELKKGKESVAAQPTPQQEMFGAICEAIGWDYKTLSKDDSGQVAQAVGILQKASYTVADVRHFMTNFWFKDWRWKKEGKPPTLRQLRQEIGIIRSTLQAAAPQPEKKGANGYFDMLAEEGINVWPTK